MLFDDQAKRFDTRAGFPVGVPESIAQAILRMAEKHSSGALLEIGAGTGEIGLQLASQAKSYLGIDLSFPMIKTFREKSGNSVGLAQADGDAPWPIASQCVSTVFGSRSLHYIRPQLLSEELTRVGIGEVLVIVGSVYRDEGSVRDVMRREMRRLLRERGYQARSGGKNKQGLWEVLGGRGGRALRPITAAKWVVSASPSLSLLSWESKAGLAGMEVPEDVKRCVLEDLRNWALRHYARLEEIVPSQEAYILEGMRVAV